MAEEVIVNETLLDDDYDDHDDKNTVSDGSGIIDAVFKSFIGSEEECLHSGCDESKIDTVDLLRTYNKLYTEKVNIDKELREVLMLLHTKEAELADKSRRISVVLDDNIFLRTKNQILRNKLKVVKQLTMEDCVSDCESDNVCKTIEAYMLKKSWKMLHVLIVQIEMN